MKLKKHLMKKYISPAITIVSVESVHQLLSESRPEKTQVSFENDTYYEEEEDEFYYFAD